MVIIKKIFFTFGNNLNKDAGVNMYDTCLMAKYSHPVVNGKVSTW